MNEDQQSRFEGWAKIEIFGRQQHIGFCRTETYGQATLFRIDTPELPERDYVLTEPAYTRFTVSETRDVWESRWTPAGATVRKLARPGSTVLVGAGSIYRIIPCTEAAAMLAIDQTERAELKLISLPERNALGSGEVSMAEHFGVTEEDDPEYRDTIEGAGI